MRLSCPHTKSPCCDTTKMDGLIAVTRPIREEWPTAHFKAMEEDAMDSHENP